MRFVIWMLRLYPPAWRERYEAEMVALLVIRLISWRVSAIKRAKERPESSLELVLPSDAPPHNVP